MNIYNQEIHDFYSKFGKINTIGQISPKEIIIYYEKITNKNIPLTFKDFSVKFKKIGKVKPLKDKNI